MTSFTEWLSLLAPGLFLGKEELDRSSGLQQEIWSRAVAACRETGSSQASILLLPALNQMFDITTTRTMAGRIHPPWVVFMLLAVLALTSALLVGFGMAESRVRSGIHIVAFAAFMALTIFIIIDLEYPRVGFIRVDSFDQVLVDLRQGMEKSR